MPHSETAASMYCRRCGYQLVGLSENRCPECNQPFDPDNAQTFYHAPRQELLRRRIRWIIKFAAIAMVAALIPAVCCLGWAYWEWYPDHAAVEAVWRAGGDVNTYIQNPPRGMRRWPLRYLLFLWERADAVWLHCPSEGLPEITDAQMAPLAGMRRLTSLDLGDGRLSEQALQHISQMRTLESVEFHDPNATDTCIHYLRQLYKLRALGVDKTQVSDAGMPIIAGLLRLTYLGLEGTRITDAGMAHLAGLPLSTLRLGNTAITDQGLIYLKNIRTLDELDLHGTNLAGSGLANLQNLSSLRELDLSHTQIDDAGLAHLKGLTTVNYLNLSGTNVTDQGLIYLKGFTALERIDLPDQTTDAGLIHLRNLTVGQIGLHGRHITRATLQSLKSLPYVGYLDLSDSGIVDADLECLKQLPPIGLNLSGTCITDAGIEHLVTHPHLHSVSLDRTRVTPAGVRRLAQALPKADIYFRPMPPMSQPAD